jgi:hypothetical protein
MSKGKKLHRAVINIPEPEQIFGDYSELMEKAQDMIDYYCSYDCYYMDCGLACPDDCPMHYWYDVLESEQNAEENDVLHSLGFEK